MCSVSNRLGDVRVIREAHDQFSSRFLSIFPQSEYMLIVICPVNKRL